jgi:hypothetical protein
LNKKRGKTTIVALSMLLSGASGAVFAEKPEKSLKVGGAIRINYAYKDYGSEAHKDKNGDLAFELFRLDVDARMGKWYLDGEYRWYRDFGFDTVHHAFVGYDLDPNNQIEFGIHQVPFGLEGYASHSFWFSGAYYLGFEDDYDAGIKWRNKGDKHRFELAYYHNSELKSNDFNRYSFDIADETATDYYSFDGDTSRQVSNEEAGQLNVRYVRDFGPVSLGVSGQLGRIINTSNSDDVKSANMRAYAIHANANLGQWNIQAEAIKYKYDETSDIGTQDGTIGVSGFAYASDIAASATVGILNVSRKFEVNNNVLDAVTCYNDFTLVDGDGENGGESIQNVTGCMFSKGGMYTYLDFIRGKNMYFDNGVGVGVSDSEAWNSRVNLNVGWYF